jgi:hypothetical protein
MIEYRFRVPSAAVFTLCSYSKTLKYRFRVPTAGSLKLGRSGRETTRSGYSKGYSKDLEYEYTLKTAALGTLKRYFILSFTLYLEWYSAYFTVGSARPH